MAYLVTIFAARSYPESTPMRGFVRAQYNGENGKSNKKSKVAYAPFRTSILSSRLRAKGAVLDVRWNRAVIRCMIEETVSIEQKGRIGTRYLPNLTGIKLKSINGIIVIKAKSLVSFFDFHARRIDDMRPTIYKGLA